MKEVRKLSSILFADIANYTAMMQADESGALAKLTRFKSILEKEVLKEDGKIIQYYGDGCLLSFDNTLRAVSCAKALQLEFQNKPKVPVRIGLHLGEVLFKENNVYGDGVNLASRVESMGVAGAVLFSKAVYEQIRNKPEFQPVSLGIFEFKNVAEPMEVFALKYPGLVVPKRDILKGKRKYAKEAKKPWRLRKGTKKIARNLVIYLLIAWLGVESFALFVNKQDLDPEFINLLVIAAVFGIPATLIFSIFKRRFNWKAIGLQLLCLILCIYTLFGYFYNPTILNPDSLRLIKLDPSEQNPFTSLKSMAILPFGNLMNDSTQAYLLAGMHDGLISEIGKLGSLRIISRTSTLPYANTTMGMKKIAGELNVDAIMEGTITRADSMVDLRLKLVDVFPEEKTLWSESYRASFAELPKLYRNVTEKVAREINQVISPAEQQKLSRNDSVNPLAYKAYLRGSYYTGFLNRDGFERAENYFGDALELAPDYAPAYVGMAGLWMAKRQKYLVSPDSANSIIKGYLDKAMELNDSLPDLWSSLGAYHFTTTYNWAKSEEAFRRSIVLNPNNPRSRNGYAHLLMILNRWEEAWKQMGYSEVLAPNSPWTIAFSAVMYANEGKLLSSLKRWEELKEIAPENIMAVYADLIKHAKFGQHDKAIADLKRVLSYISMGDLQSLVDSTYLASDFKTTVRVVAERLENRADTTFIAPSFMIRLYGMLLQDREKFFYYLQRMYETNDPDLGYFGIKKVANPWMEDHRYSSIMEKIGLW